MIIMAPTAAKSIEFGHNPQTPKSRKNLPFQTPTTKSPNTKENVSTPRRAKFLNTLKSLSVRRSARNDSETNSPKSLGKRKSAWDLFARLSQKGSSNDVSSIHTEAERTKTLSPFKERLGGISLSGETDFDWKMMEILTSPRE
jgi:hypothetical protein